MKNSIKSEWILANAGSGKTTQLTRRVVRLLLLGVPAERIVCITYTKAAASEMRERILSLLRQLFLADDARCVEQLHEILGNTPSNDIIVRAKSLFTALLDSPTGGVQVTTIHGFCQNILRRFPLEAGIVPHFTVLEEAMADTLLREATRALLSEAADNPWLHDALMLVGARGGESRFNSVTADILKKRTLWRRIWHKQAPDSLRQHFWALHGLRVDDDEPSLNTQMLAMLAPNDEAVVRAHLPEMLADKRVSYRAFGKGLSAWLALDVAQCAHAIDAFLDLFLTDKRTIRKNLVDVKRHPEGSPLAQVITHWAELALRLHTQRAALACAEETFAIAVLARALDDQYRIAKTMAHALDYEDMIELTLDLMCAPAMMGWVMRKLDHRIEHLLIDEAQDNSLMQWDLAHQLVEELIASKEHVATGAIPASLLVVGDEKQSIYSFQGAAPEAFSRYQQSFRSLLAQSAAPLEMLTLSNSYRSTACILQLVDAVCALPNIAPAISSAGITARHQLIRTKAEDSGRVMLYPIIEAQEKTTFEPLVIPKTYQVTSSASQLLADKIADTIADWLAQQRLLISKNQPIHAGDILILVRKRTTLVPLLIRALQRRKVAVAGIDRLKLASHLAVRDLLALMQWCLNASDDLALAQVLRSPLVGMSDAELCAIAHPRTGTLWQALDNPWLAQVRSIRGRAPYDFLTEVLEVSNRRHEFVRRFGDEVHEILDELKAQAAAMPAGMPQTIAYFQDWLSNSVREIKRESAHGEDNEVRIMTVHGAKGLEAPIVILADTVDVPTTSREVVFPMPSAAEQPLAALSISAISKFAPRLVAAKEERKQAMLAEYQRLLYVAITRARDELHVFGATGRKGEIDSASWYHTIRTALEVCEATTCDDGVMALFDPVPEVKSALSVDVAAAAKTTLPAWVTHRPDAEPATPSMPVIAPHSLTVSDYGQEAVGDAKARGVRIHRLFELFDAHHDAQAVAQMVDYLCPDWDAPSQEALVSRMLALREAEPWLWQYKRRAEVSISGQVMQEGQSVTLNRQMDLLVETPDAILILDYKTSAHVPKDVGAMPREYVEQLKTYRALLAPIYPSLPIRCGIIWTEHPRIMWLADAMLAA